MSLRAFTLGLLFWVGSLYAAKLPNITVESFLFNFQLDAATRVVDQLAVEGHRQFYAAHIEMYRFFATQDPAYSKKLKENWKDYIKAVEGLPKDEKDILLAELNGKRAIVEFLENNYVLSSRFARASYNLVKAYEKAYPGRAESLKMLGLFNVVLGNVPRRYQWVANLLGYKGDLQLGISQLEEAGRESRLLKHESLLILSTIEKSMLDNPYQALQRLQDERAQQKDNILLDYFSASALMRVKKNEEALQILMSGGKYKKNGVQQIPFWNFLQGKACYFKNDFSGAQRHFALFVRGYKGKLMRTDAYFRLGMSLTLNNRYDLGKPFFDLMAKEDHGGFDEDEYAQFMARKFADAKPDPLTQALFKARNYFDGGYYSKSLAILRQLTYLIPKDDPKRTELYYRYARVYHSMGKLDMARKYYNSSVEAEGGQEHTYLKAYASYFLGEIAREEGKQVLAVNNYKQALTYENYFYQSGLENRCKAALSILR